MSRMENSIIKMLDDPRVWERVERLSIPEPNSGCALWEGHLDKDGYPKMSGPRDNYKRSSVTVSKLVLAKKLGRVPTKSALHTCDVRCCVAENHLYEGTNRQNVHDMYRRGRRIIVRDEYGKITRSPD